MSIDEEDKTETEKKTGDMTRQRETRDKRQETGDKTKHKAKTQ